MGAINIGKVDEKEIDSHHGSTFINCELTGFLRSI